MWGKMLCGAAAAAAAGTRGLRQRAPRGLPPALLRKPAPPRVPAGCEPSPPGCEPSPPGCEPSPPTLAPCVCPCSQPCCEPCSDPCSDKDGGGGGGKRAISIENMNPNVVKLEYAVRGPIVDRAFAIMRGLKEGTLKKPYSQVIEASVGDAHAMGQAPITFLRQVLSAMMYPELMKTVKYPEDVVKRAKELMANLGGGSVGAYTASLGVEHVRRHVAGFIARRDGQPARWQDVALSNGASAGIKIVLQLFSNNPNGNKSGVMVPIPQYPLYSATIAEYGLEMAPYFLDEERRWGLRPRELERSRGQAAAAGTDVRAIVVINPGNPTGQVLSRKDIEDVIKFAHKHALFIFADEVYQDNVYDEKFYSFKKVLRELGAPYCESVQLASYMSVSKGYAGECGLRGGWTELVNVDAGVQRHLYKSISALLCPSVVGQACTDLVGAMYAFPRMTLPEKALRAAREARQEPDLFYAFQLLEETGICVVPGSGFGQAPGTFGQAPGTFGQAPGTFHLRTTILPNADVMRKMVDMFQTFHRNFTKKYS